MTRTATSSPLVERDADGSLVPAGRQMATNPPRTDDRSSYGLTDVDEVIFQYAADEVNGLHSRIDQYVTIEESKAMLAEGIGSAASDQKAAWLTTYRASHPLPTSYSDLPPGDPSLYVPPVVFKADGPSPIITDGVYVENHPAAPFPLNPIVAPAYGVQPTVPLITIKPIPPIAPPATPAPSHAESALATAVAITEFAEAHPQALSALVGILRSFAGLFTHKAA